MNEYENDGYERGMHDGALKARQEVAQTLTEVRNRPDTSGSEMALISQIAIDLGLKVSTTVTYTA